MSLKIPKIEDLQKVASRRDIANRFNYSLRTFIYLIYKKEDRYSFFTIPKKDGGTRNIEAPCPQLKLIQRKLASSILQFSEKEDEKIAILSRFSHGFVRGKSILTNAMIHVNAKFVFNIDISDFFGSIHFGRIRGFLTKNKFFSLSKDTSTILAQLVCNQGHLPQGSPSSPVVSNLIANIIDKKLSRIAIKNGCRYSRYADDITFSTRNSKFPEDIACYNQEEKQWKVGEKLFSILKDSGFQVNPKKTRMQFKRSRQEVTGLIVNERVNCTREYRHRIRAMTYNLLKNGKFTINSEVGRVQQLQGMLSFIYSVDKFYYRSKFGDKFKDEINKSSFFKLYKIFSVYRKFLHELPEPIVVCEGNTDVSHLKIALENLQSFYPDLIEKNVNGKINRKIRFVYLDKKFSEATKLSSGTGGLKGLIEAIKEINKKYLLKWNERIVVPVILLVDGDTAGTNIFTEAKKNITANKINNDNCINFLNYCYILKLSKDNVIEDLYDKFYRDTPWNGKKLNLSNDSSKDQYGKEAVC